AAEQFVYRRAVTNVERCVLESLRSFLQSFQIPRCVARGPKEKLAHVVVHAYDFVASPVEELGGFRANQSAASRNQNFQVLQSISSSGGMANQNLSPSASDGLVCK